MVTGSGRNSVLLHSPTFPPQNQKYHQTKNLLLKHSKFKQEIHHSSCPRHQSWAPSNVSGQLHEHFWTLQGFSQFPLESCNIFSMSSGIFFYLSLNELDFMNIFNFAFGKVRQWLNIMTNITIKCVEIFTGISKELTNCCQ